MSGYGSVIKVVGNKLGYSGHESTMPTDSPNNNEYLDYLALCTHNPRMGSNIKMYGYKIGGGGFSSNEY